MRHVHLLLLPFVFFREAVAAPDYALSPDGSAVVRLVPQQAVSAGTLAATPLPGSYAVTTGAGPSPAVTSYAAGFQGGSGGAQFTALYNNGAALAAGQGLNWVQVINTNLPLGGAVSPYLDNARNPGTPFYSFTNENRDPTLPANQINFYDYSRRSPSSLATTNPITWNASLYPVITTAGSTSLEAENGVAWGWTMKKATAGSASGTFNSPNGGVVSGVGTNAFTWGTGEPSSLTFAGQTFDTAPNTPFSLGRLTFHNGTINGGTGADSVVFDVPLSFDNVAEKNFDFQATLNLVNTPNTDDPIASADQVVVNGFGYTFNVVEGGTASVDVLAELTTGLSVTPAGVNVDALFSPDLLDPSPDYRLVLLGFAAPTEGGFVTGVPEPSSLVIAASALMLLRLRQRGRPQ